MGGGELSAGGCGQKRLKSPENPRLTGFSGLTNFRAMFNIALQVVVLLAVVVTGDAVRACRA